MYDHHLTLCEYSVVKYPTRNQLLSYHKQKRYHMEYTRNKQCLFYKSQCKHNQFLYIFDCHARKATITHFLFTVYVCQETNILVLIKVFSFIG